MDLFAAYADSPRNYSLKFSIAFTLYSNGQMRLKDAYAAKESIPMKLRELSICQNWSTGPLPDQSVW